MLVVKEISYPSKVVMVVVVAQQTVVKSLQCATTRPLIFPKNKE